VRLSDSSASIIDLHLEALGRLICYGVSESSMFGVGN
jgi:hypothetical protein